MELSGIVLTTSDIGGFPMEGIETSKQVSALCRTNRLWGYKNDKGPFSRWLIPVESFAIYLHENPELKKNFECMCDVNYGYWKERDHHMVKIVDAIKKALNIYSPSNPPKEMITVEMLSKIFDLPKNQIEAMFLSKTQRIVTRRELVPVADVLEFLHKSPSFLDLLYQRRSQLVEEKNPDERYVGHLLMLYEYRLTKTNSQNLHVL